MHFVLRVIARLGVQVYAVRARPLTRNPVPHDLPPEIRVGMIDRETLYRASGDDELRLSREFVDAALARGDVACGAMHGDRLIAYLWRTSKIAPHENGLWVRVTPPYHYGYKGFTHPDYRGQHINPALAFASDTYFLEHGLTHMVGFVDLRNASSLATGKTKRLSIVGYAGYGKWFGRCFPYRTPAVTRIGFEFFNPSR